MSKLPTQFMVKPDPDTPGRFLLSWKTSDREEWKALLEQVKNLPGRLYVPSHKAWSIPAEEGGGASAAQKQAQEIGFIFGDTKALSKVEKKALVPPPKDLHQIRINPERVHSAAYDYQVDFIRFMLQREGRGLLADDMGTGKTLQSLMWAMYARRYPCLIVVLAPTKAQWERAWKQWHPKGHPQRDNIKVLYGRTPEPIEEGVNYIINWDILCDWTGSTAKGLPMRMDGPLGRAHFRYLIGDEIQKIGNPSSKMSKAFRALGRKSQDLAALSGTPIRSRPKQFWPILNLLDKDNFPNHFHFLNRYCDPKSNGFGMQYDGSSNPEELFFKVQPLMLRRMKKDVMKDLPPKTTVVVPLEVNRTAMDQYKTEETEVFTDTEASVKEQRDRVAGLLHSAYLLKEKAALEWVQEFLEIGGGKLILFCWHRDVVSLAVKELSKYSPAQIDGGITGHKREGMVEKFRTDPKCRLLVANIQAGGTGLDGLQDACSHVAFLEFSHTATDHAQAEDRLHRGGQMMPVTAYYLIAPETVDDDAIESLDRGKAVIGQLLDGEASEDVDMLTEILARRGMERNGKT